MNYQTHLEAGLVDGGTNEDGEVLYIGTDKQWHLYEQLEAGKAQQEKEMKRTKVDNVIKLIKEERTNN